MICSFCSNEVKKGTGFMYVKADGSTAIFCSSKCKKNALKLGRIGRKLKWTKAFVIFKEQQLKKGQSDDNKNK
ncbi:MAG: 50S ribosomal protein L24e [Candidatus Anstonellales archaeon]